MAMPTISQLRDTTGENLSHLNFCLSMPYYPVVTHKPSNFWRALLLAVLLPTASTVSQAAVLCSHLGESPTNHVDFSHGLNRCVQADEMPCETAEPPCDEHAPCDDVQLEVDQVRPGHNEDVALTNKPLVEWTIPLGSFTPTSPRLCPRYWGDSPSVFTLGPLIVQAIRFNL